MNLDAIAKVVVPTPGTPVRVTVAAGLPNPAEVYPCHAIQVIVLPTNTGKVYGGVQGMDKTVLVGCYFWLPPPTETTVPSWSAAITIAPNGLRLEDLWIDADNPNDGVIVNVLVA